MKRIHTLLMFAFCLSIGYLQAQDVRYLDQVFDQVSVESDVVYANNITVLTGTPAPEDLLMDVYTPVGDTETSRPVVIYIHTGSFLPQYINGQITGSRSDSTVVEVCTRLAKMGYVAIAATYRLGWNPAALGPDGQDTRTGTLLNAAYRGIQDFRAALRFLRKTVAEDGNPYGIDTDKMVGWGQGTGGYITLGAAYLDEFEEVILPKFISQATALPYVDTSLSGNVLGTLDRPLCIANWPDYSSDFAMAINMGGALGDASWIDGDASTITEPATIGFHVATDPFAPFGNGPVIVPTTGDFVVNVSGTRTVLDTANSMGVNSVLDPITNLVNELNLINQALQPVPFQFPGQEATTLATDHMFPFLTPGNRPEAGPWDWWDKPTLDFIISQYPPEFMLNSDTLHNNGLLTNPDMSADKARAYIDTVMAYYIPRACIALGLDDCLTALGVVDVEEIEATEVGLQIAPNPAAEQVIFRSDAEHPILDVAVFDSRGLLIRSQTNIDDYNYTFQRSNLPPGIYFAKIRFEAGVLTKQIMFK